MKAAERALLRAVPDTIRVLLVEDDPVHAEYLRAMLRSTRRARIDLVAIGALLPKPFTPSALAAKVREVLDSTA